MSIVTRAFSLVASAVLVAALGAAVVAAQPATKDEAVAMVKKAVAYIKAEGPDTAYPAIDDHSGQFVDRNLYVVVYGLDGMVLAHGADKARIGTNQLTAKDPDGKAFVQERVELAAKEPSFWQQYKFMNPVSKTVEPKEMYCERLAATVVCAGVYRSDG
jgi:cytochrome c